MSMLIPILLVLFNAVSVLLVLIGLPGTWLMVACTGLVAWWQWAYGGGATPLFSVPVLVAVLVLALLGELLEFVAGMAGTKRAGGTRRGAIGALLGTIVGGIAGSFLIPVPLVGSLIGACGGAALGAWGFELWGGRTMRESMRSGWGAGWGRLYGTVAKFVVAVTIWIVTAVAAFWP